MWEECGRDGETGTCLWTNTGKAEEEKESQIASKSNYTPFFLDSPARCF